MTHREQLAQFFQNLLDELESKGGKLRPSIPNGKSKIIALVQNPYSQARRQTKGRTTLFVRKALEREPTAEERETLTQLLNHPDWQKGRSQFAAQRNEDSVIEVREAARRSATPVQDDFYVRTPLDEVYARHVLDDES